MTRPAAGVSVDLGGGAGEPAAVHVVLLEPEIHWNTGNAGRTCLAVGATLHLVEPLGFQLDERSVRRAGLDYWPKVDLRVWPSWEAFEGAGLGPPFLISPDGPRTIWDADLRGAPVLVFGRESVGLPAPLRARHADRLFRLPMRAQTVRSLNLSTSVGVVTYEVLRQNGGLRCREGGWRS